METVVDAFKDKGYTQVTALVMLGLHVYLC